jgi:hypothetical protein
MKKQVMLMLAALVAASTLTAQDTMVVRSYRTIDMCSGERRWTIAPYLGRMRSTDSLMSFDITIGYDTSVIRPTDVLTEGTLSHMLDFPAFMSLVVPGEIRVGGFNTTRAMIGDLPVVAIAGNFIGACGEFDTLSVPWPPTFNEEFEKVVTVYKTEPIVTVANERLRSDVGSSISADSITIERYDSTGTIDIDVALPSLTRSKLLLSLAIEDSTIAVMTNANVRSAVVDSMHMQGGMIKVWMTQDGDAQPRVTVTVRNAVRTPRASTRLTASTTMLDSCQCVLAGLKDTVLVVCSDPMVSVSSSVDDDNVRLRITERGASCQCDHGQTNEIAVYTVLGELVRIARSDGMDETFSSFEGLPHGSYVIMARCGENRKSVLKLK